MNIHFLPARVEALLFDIDNTLYKNDEYYHLQTDLLVERYAKDRGVDLEVARRTVENAKERYRAANSGRSTSMGNVMLSLGVPISTNCRWRDELFEPEQHLSGDNRVVTAVRQLASRFKIAALTNNTVNIGERTLAVLGLLELFPVIIGLDTCGVSKPEPEPFLAALKALGVPAGKTASIGDRFEVDIEMPLSLGMGGILIEKLADLISLPEFL